MHLKLKLYSLWCYIRSFDYWLIFGLLALYLINGLVQYSANDQNLTMLYSDLSYLGIGYIVMLIIAGVHISKIRSLAIYLYLISLLLIILVLIIGIEVNGAKRWLSIGIRIQPSEICKISVPLMVAYFLSLRERLLSFKDFFLAFILIIIPFGLIAKEPDLGTGLLVFASGFYVLFLAGISWRVIIISLVGLASLSPIIWNFLHDYQKHRILTLINPESDPLGKGYHIIQGVIAIGSGGLWGQGYLKGSQVHLNFIPEKHTDFVITIIAEEFGYIGVLTLLGIYLLITLRALNIMQRAENRFTKILAGSIALSFMTYVLINMGMVSGIFPVVGVPLPLVSYGGTASLVIMVSFGILLSIDHSYRYHK